MTFSLLFLYVMYCARIKSSWNAMYWTSPWGCLVEHVSMRLSGWTCLHQVVSLNMSPWGCLVEPVSMRLSYCTCGWATKFPIWAVAEKEANLHWTASGGKRCVLLEDVFDLLQAIVGIASSKTKSTSSKASNILILIETLSWWNSQTDDCLGVVVD